MGWATLSGPVAVNKKRLEAAVGERGSTRTSETPQGTRLGGFQKGSLLLCYAGPLAKIQKSGISSNRRRPKPTPWKRNSWGS